LNKMKMPDRCGLLISLLFLVHPSSGRSNTASYCADGIVEGRFFRPTGAVDHDASAWDTFRLLCSGDGRWSLRLNREGRGDRFSVSACDGTDVFNAIYTTEASSNGVPTGGRVPVSANINHAFVDPGAFPSSADYNARFIWTALASSAYLDTRPLPVSLPWRNERFDMLAYGFRWNATRFAKPPRLPRRILFVRSTNLDLGDAQELRRPALNLQGSPDTAFLKNRLAQRRRFWPQGFVAGSFEVLATTNFDGALLPMSFRCQAAMPTAYRSHRLADFTGTVTNLSRLGRGRDLLPPILGTLAVIDWRFRARHGGAAVDGVSYDLSRNGAAGRTSWPSREDPLLADQFALKMSMAFNRPASLERRRLWVMLTLLLVGLCAPAAWYWVSGRHKRRGV
jgi:hypothetical protein